MQWYNSLGKTIYFSTTSINSISYSINNSKTIKSTSPINTILKDSYPCALNKRKHPTRAPLDEWKTATITINSLDTKSKTRDIIQLFTKQMPLTTSQQQFINEGFHLPHFFKNLKTTERINDHRKNCGRNKWGPMYHHKDKERCSLCEEKNNSMHIIYCFEINRLEIKLTGNDESVITRIKASKNHKSVHHIHSWIINKARWNLNNKILYNSQEEEMHENYRLNFLKQQIKLLEYDHLQLVRHKFTKITKEQLSMFRYFDLIKNKIVAKPIKPNQY